MPSQFIGLPIKVNYYIRALGTSLMSSSMFIIVPRAAGTVNAVFNACCDEDLYFHPRNITTTLIFLLRSSGPSLDIK